MNISYEELESFAGAHVYADGTSLSWLHKELLKIKQAVASGEAVSVDEGHRGVVEIDSLDAFYTGTQKLLEQTDVTLYSFSASSLSTCSFQTLNGIQWVPFADVQ